MALLYDAFTNFVSSFSLLFVELRSEPKPLPPFAGSEWILLMCQAIQKKMKDRSYPRPTKMYGGKKRIFVVVCVLWAGSDFFDGMLRVLCFHFFVGRGVKHVAGNSE